MKKARILILSLAIFSLFTCSVAGSLFPIRSAASAPLIQDDDRVNAMAATETNKLIGFDITKPEEILSAVDITGLQEGEKINSLMLDPNTVLNPPPGPVVLFVATNQGRFYTIDTETGQALRFGNLQLFIGEDFDAVLLPEAPAAAGDALFTETGSTKVLTATEEEAIEVDMDKSEVFSGLFVYDGELDPNFGKQPCIVDIQSASDFGFRGEVKTRVFGFDKNQCAIVRIERVDKVTGIAAIATELPLAKEFASGIIEDKKAAYIDYLGALEAQAGAGSQYLFDSAPDSDEKRLNKVDSIKNEDDNIERLKVIVGDKVGIIGSITTDSPIRAVTATRVVPPDYALSTDEPTITLKRGEKIKLDINILRLEGFTGNITVNRPDALPNKVKIKPASVSTTGDSVKFKKIKIKGSAQPGTYPLEFTAIDEMGRVRKAIVNLVIE